MTSLIAADLRKAAETLRHLTTQATEGPWVQHPGARQLLVTANGQHIVGRQVTVSNAPYIATMHPGVGLALADWLDATAERAETRTGTRRGGKGRYLWDATRIARLINGGAS